MNDIKTQSVSPKVSQESSTISLAAMQSQLKDLGIRYEFITEDDLKLIDDQFPGHSSEERELKIIPYTTESGLRFTLVEMHSAEGILYWRTPEIAGDRETEWPVYYDWLVKVAG